MTTVASQLRVIASLGEQRTDIKKLGHTITLRLLNAGETRDIFVASSAIDIFAREKVMAIKTLARAILAIDGTELRYEVNSPNEPVTEYKMINQNEIIVETWPWEAVSSVYSEYLKFEAECAEKFKKQAADFLEEKNG